MSFDSLKYVFFKFMSKNRTSFSMQKRLPDSQTYLKFRIISFTALGQARI